MRRLLAALVALLFLCWAAFPVYAQPEYAQAVSACGTPNNSPVTGGVYPITQDLLARQCVAATISGGTSLSPLGVTTTNDSGTVATGSTFQTAIAASASRLGCLVQNPTTASEVLFVYFGTNASATTAKSVTLGPGASISCVAGGTVLTDNVSVTAATSTHAFMAQHQ